MRTKPKRSRQFSGFGSEAARADASDSDGRDSLVGNRMCLLFVFKSSIFFLDFKARKVWVLMGSRNQRGCLFAPAFSRQEDVQFVFERIWEPNFFVGFPTKILAI